MFRRIWAFVRHPRKLLQRLEIARDFSAFSRKHPFLKLRGPAKPTGDIVLLVSLIDSITQVKMEGMLAKALQFKGAEPVVLTWRTCKRAQMYFRAFGINRFIFLDDLIADVEKEFDPSLAPSVLRECGNFKKFLGYAYKDVRVGNHVLSTVVRRLRQGSGSFHDPHPQALLRELLPRSLKTVLAAERLFADLHPRVVLFVEKGYSPYGEVFDAATSRGIPCVQNCHSHRADALVLKRYSRETRGQHPFSLSAKTWERVKRMPWDAAEERQFMEELRVAYEKGTWFNRKFLLQDKKVKAPEEVRVQLKLDPRKKTAVIFSHVLWDATFFFGETLFDDYEHWLVESVKAACENDRVNWIVKLHPDYVWKMKQMGETGDPRDIVALQSNIGTLPDHIQVVMPNIDISTYSFFSVTDWCITVRGTIGIEAPCFGIPVITAGTGRYSGLGFTDDSATREEYLNKLRHIENIPRLSAERTSLALRHARALFMLRPFPFTAFTLVKNAFSTVGKRLEDNTEICASSLDDLLRASDMRTYAEWVLHSTDEDYLHLLPPNA